MIPDQIDAFRALALSDVLGQMRTPTMVLDKDLRFVFANPAYLEMTQTSSAQLLGAYLFDIFPEVDDRVEKLKSLFLAVFDGETTFLKAEPYDIKSESQDVEAKFWEAVQEPLYLANGEVGFMLQQAHDVTAAVLLEKERELIAMELDHRTKNVLAVVQSVARMASRLHETKEDFTKDLLGRLDAMTRTHARLYVNDFEGMGLGDLLRDALAAMSSESSFTLSGENIQISERIAKDLSMLVHELATNAAKHGAFSKNQGHLNVSWALADEQVNITWVETGVGHVDVIADEGFGSKLFRMIRTIDCKRWGGADGLHVTLSFAHDV